MSNLTERVNTAAVLKGVVAYVDVWSANRKEDYSNPFIQQLLDMGAEVSKTFNKHVTHVVFKHGRPSTWKKAQKTGSRTVSVHWVARCQESGEHVDEGLFPALHEESTHVLNKRTHQCMQPRDFTVKTPENDRRMKRKLDRMIEDLNICSPVVAQTSPFIIDEESGIVYSPSLKRSESMARRLREMRAQHQDTADDLNLTSTSHHSPLTQTVGKSHLNENPVKKTEENKSVSSTDQVPFPSRSPKNSETLAATNGESKPSGKTTQHDKLAANDFPVSRSAAQDDARDNEAYEDFFSPGSRAIKRKRIFSASSSDLMRFPTFDLETFKPRHHEPKRIRRSSAAPSLDRTDGRPVRSSPPSEKKKSADFLLSTVNKVSARTQKSDQAHGDLEKRHASLNESDKENEACVINEATSDSACEGEIMKKDRYLKKNRSLVMTSMPTEKQALVFQLVASLGSFTVAEDVCDSTTHVVSGSPRRTLNVLLGIARGCWLLSFDWILQCLESGTWVSEDAYELSDHFPAAPICRLQQHLSAGEHQQDLFQDQLPMFVSPHSQPPCGRLTQLIQLCGGSVCRSRRQAGLCIGQKHQGTRSLSEKWVLDCVTQLSLLPHDNYLL